MRVKKRRDLEETNYFVPPRTDLIENYVSGGRGEGGDMEGAIQRELRIEDIILAYKLLIFTAQWYSIYIYRKVQGVKMFVRSNVELK